MKVVDYFETLGSNIDREKNLINGVEPLLMFRKHTNSRSYNSTKMTADIKDLTNNIQLLVRVESKVKLNLLYDDDTSMVEHSDKKETHFVLFENVTTRFTLDFSIFKQLW
jgi:hypothetical protein